MWGMFRLRDKSKLVKIHICNNWPLPLLFKTLHLQPFSNCIQLCLWLSVRGIFFVPCSHSLDSHLVLCFLDSKLFYDKKRFRVSFNRYTVVKGYTDDHHYEIQNPNFCREFHVHPLHFATKLQLLQQKP